MKHVDVVTIVQGEPQGLFSVIVVCSFSSCQTYSVFKIFEAFLLLRYSLKVYFRRVSTSLCECNVKRLLWFTFCLHSCTSVFFHHMATQSQKNAHFTLSLAFSFFQKDITFVQMQLGANGSLRLGGGNRGSHKLRNRNKHQGPAPVLPLGQQFMCFLPPTLTTPSVCIFGKAMWFFFSNLNLFAK